PLVVRDNPVRHLLRGETAVLEHRDDDRNVDVREDVRRGPRDREWSDAQDEQREDDERVRAVQRDADDPHGTKSPFYLAPVKAVVTRCRVLQASIIATAQWQRGLLNTTTFTSFTCATRSAMGEPDTTWG